MRIFALVKEEFKSYFESGAVDDLLFPIYVTDCLDKLGRSSLKLNEWVLDLRDFQATLPPDFIAVREAWMCAPYGVSLQQPFSFYQQVTQTSTNLTPGDIYCEPCTGCGNPDIIQLVYKTNSEVLYTFEHQYLLRPGNISKMKDCQLWCRNTDEYSSPDTFDIRDNKFVTNFRTGVVHLVYYSEEYDDKGYQMIPDNYRIKKFIELYLKLKIVEQLCNQATDETYAQLERKKEDYQHKADEAFISADTETKKETIYQKNTAIKRTQRRHNKYKIQ